MIQRAMTSELMEAAREYPVVTVLGPRQSGKTSLNGGKRPDLYFYRDTHGNEVDLILRHGRRLIPIEIKSASTFTAEFLKGIEGFRKTVGNRCGPGYVLYNGPDEFQIRTTRVLNLMSHGSYGDLVADS